VTEPTIYEHLLARGYSRREFLKISAAIAGAMGLRASPLGALAGSDGPSPGLVRAVARALQTTPRQPVIWLAFQDCAGCTEAISRSTDPPFLDLLLDRISLDYHETLAAGAGAQVEAYRQQVMRDYRGRYVLVVEGSIPSGDDGVYCTVGGRSALDLLSEAADGAKAIVATGNCASYGGIPRARPDPTAARSVSQLLAGRTVINIPGCPAIPEVTAGTLATLVVTGAAPEIDRLGRPLAFYGATIHDQCERRRFFRRGQFARSFDDAGARQGWCLFELGCRGPVTYNACPRQKWAGLSFPVQSGHPCLGCAEPDFWDGGGFYHHLPGPFQAYLPRADRTR
jgi:hydrogenase small subunit